MLCGMMTAPTIPTALSTAFPGTEGINKPAVVKHTKFHHNAIMQFQGTKRHSLMLISMYNSLVHLLQKVCKSLAEVQYKMHQKDKIERKILNMKG
jgi:hypothetical protein